MHVKRRIVTQGRVKRLKEIAVGLKLKRNSSGEGVGRRFCEARVLEFNVFQNYSKHKNVYFDCLFHACGKRFPSGIPVWCCSDDSILIKT